MQFYEQQRNFEKVFICHGILHDASVKPEKRLEQLTAASINHVFNINTITPVLWLKQLLPVLKYAETCQVTIFSARVGSINDNHMGGWYSYRASKAALNQLVHTAAIELSRKKPEALCVALHPGTVDTGLSSGFAKSGLTVRAPQETAALLLSVLDRLGSSQSGGFFDYEANALPW